MCRVDIGWWGAGSGLAQHEQNHTDDAEEIPRD